MSQQGEHSQGGRGLLARARSRLGKWLRGAHKIGRPELSRPTLRLGGRAGGWTVDPTLLGGESVVYSVGIGQDVSFDVALSERFGCVVHAFDPTPRSLRWVAGQTLPGSLRVHPVGLSDRDGQIEMFEPPSERHVSHTVVAGAGGAGSVRVPVQRLGTMMRTLGHDRVDLLKMDIEGAEYAVIRDLAAQGPAVGQLLVEFHHRFPSVGDAATRNALHQLSGAGYRLFHISDSWEEYAFVHESALRH